MTDAERQQLNIAIAEALDARGLGRYAWDPAKTCPQGHPNIDPECGECGAQIGEECWECGTIWIEQRYVASCPTAADLCSCADTDHYGEASEEWDTMMTDPTVHPEWRIGRVPKDFTKPEVLLPAVEECREFFFGAVVVDGMTTDVYWLLSRLEKGWFVSGTLSKPNWEKTWGRRGQTIAEAMAKAFQEMLFDLKEEDETYGV